MLSKTYKTTHGRKKGDECLLRSSGRLDLSLTVGNMIIEMAKQRHAQGATVRTLDRLCISPIHFGSVSTVNVWPLAAYLCKLPWPELQDQTADETAALGQHFGTWLPVTRQAHCFVHYSLVTSLSDWAD